MNRANYRWLTVTAALVVVLFIAFWTCALYVMNAHAVSIDLISKVDRGDPSDRITALLGEPTRVDEHETGESWVYSGVTWCYVTVCFNSDGTVDRVVHDH